MAAHEEIWIDGPAGRLDARVQGPVDGSPVLLCHPHPAGGGSMGSRLVYDLAVGLAEAGYRTVRFNYRGVGRSDGTSGNGAEEAADAVAVRGWMCDTYGSCPVIVGHSFGGGVGLRLAREKGIERLGLVAVPARISLSALEPVEDAPHVDADVLVVVGTEDEYVTVEEAQALADAFPRRAALTVLQGAGHFLSPEDNPRVVAAVRDWLGEAPAGGL